MKRAWSDIDTKVWAAFAMIVLAPLIYWLGTLVGLDLAKPLGVAFGAACTAAASFWVTGSVPDGYVLVPAEPVNREDPHGGLKTTTETSDSSITDSNRSDPTPEQ